MMKIRRIVQAGCALAVLNWFLPQIRITDPSMAFSYGVSPSHTLNGFEIARALSRVGETGWVMLMAGLLTIEVIFLVMVSAVRKPWPSWAAAAWAFAMVVWDQMSSSTQGVEGVEAFQITFWTAYALMVTGVFARSLKNRAHPQDTPVTPLPADLVPLQGPAPRT